MTTSNVVLNSNVIHEIHMRGLTIPEFAFRAGLSAATVSAAVNSQPISYRSARLVVQALIDCPVFQEFADRVAAEV